MIHSTRRGHSGSELGDRSRNEPVEEGYHDEFIDDAWRSAIVDCDSYASSKGDPDIAARDSEPADSKETEVAVELLLVAGCVDGHLGDGAHGDFGVFPF